MSVRISVRHVTQPCSRLLGVVRPATSRRVSSSALNGASQIYITAVTFCLQFFRLWKHPDVNYSSAGSIHTHGSRLPVSTSTDQTHDRLSRDGYFPSCCQAFLSNLESPRSLRSSSLPTVPSHRPLSHATQGSFLKQTAQGPTPRETCDKARRCVASTTGET